MAPRKRKQQQPEPPDDGSSSGEEEVPSSGASGSDDSSSSDDDDFPSGASSSESESEDDQDGEAFESINVDFEFFDPQEKDFHGLKALLHMLLDGEEYACSELVDAIIEQGAVGTVIKCGEEEDPIGVCTAFNLRANAHLRSLGELRAFLAAHCADEGGREALQKAWEAPGSGLVLSERLINCPPQLAPPLLKGLFEEVAAAAADKEEPEEEREAFRFKQYILVARVYCEPGEEGQAAAAAAGGSGSGGKKKGKRQKQAAFASAAALVYGTPEAESFHQHAAWSLAFPTPNRPAGKHDLVQHRLVMCVDAAKVPAALRHLEALVAAGGGGS